MKSKLRTRLELFGDAQFRKFEKRQDRNQGSNVCDDSLDWDLGIQWSRVEDHFMKEIAELKAAPEDPDELIDIANMAFLLWYRNHRRISPR